MSNIQISQNAADKIANLITAEGNSNLNLRVYIEGGGCSGFQYRFKFDEKISEDDTIITKTSSDGLNEVKLLVNALSHDYLENAEIDYTQGIQGEQFIIRNPKAKTTCGCGQSFNIDDE